MRHKLRKETKVCWMTKVVVKLMLQLPRLPSSVFFLKPQYFKFTDWTDLRNSWLSFHCPVLHLSWSLDVRSSVHWHCFLPSSCPTTSVCLTGSPLDRKVLWITEQHRSCLAKTRLQFQGCWRHACDYQSFIHSSFSSP